VGGSVQAAGDRERETLPAAWRRGSGGGLVGTRTPLEGRVDVPLPRLIQFGPDQREHLDLLPLSIYLDVKILER
jgi:hypothetical protein